MRPPTEAALLHLQKLGLEFGDMHSEPVRRVLVIKRVC